MERLTLSLTGAFAVAATVYLLGLAAQTIVLFAAARRALKREREEAPLRSPASIMRSPLCIPISVIAPAFNEEHTIVESAHSLLKLHYGEYEVIVVNDGSNDNTLREMAREFSLRSVTYKYEQRLHTKPVRGVYLSALPQYRNLIVVDKENGGKADALNTGLNFARHPLFCAIDADSLLEPEALLRITRPFYEDETTVAAGGTIRPVNGCTVRRGTVTRVALGRSASVWMQTIDYIRSFQFGRAGWDALNALLVISGAFGAFRKETVLELGGYRADSVGEDMELAVHLHRAMRARRAPYRIRFVPDAVCWTQAPPTLRALRRQRDRWQRGLFHTMLIHRSMLFNPRYGAIGMLAMPYYCVYELFGPWLELAGFVSFAAIAVGGRLHTAHTLLIIGGAVFLGVVVTLLIAAMVERAFAWFQNAGDTAKLAAAAFIETAGFRQLNTLWRAAAMVEYLFGKRSWGTVKRHRFKAHAA